jgi:hypothetical protein
VKIFVKNCNELRFHEPCDIHDPDCSFFVPSKDHSATIVTVNFEKKKIEAGNCYSISDELVQYIRIICNDNNTNTKNPFENEELSKIIIELEQATKTVVTLIKYCLKNRYINDNQIFRANVFWSIDGVDWTKIPKTSDSFTDCYGFSTLNVASFRKIQEYLENGFTPFLALKFLHRADIEEDPQVKWIEAAAAAEIGMKEFLINKDRKRYCRLKPARGQSMVEFCGDLIKQHTGEDFPKLEKLIEGARKRNRIIHGSDDLRITRKEANNYVHDVDEAIHYLLSHLYPDDWLIDQSYLFSKRRVLSEDKVKAIIKQNMDKK